MNNSKILSIITAIAVFGSIGYVAAENLDKENTDLKSIADAISKDLEAYVKDDSESKPTEEVKIQEIKEEYSEALDIGIKKVLDDAKIDYNSGTDSEKDILKQLLIQEELKWKKIEDYDRKANADEDLDKQSFNIIPPVYASNSCPTLPEVRSFKQVTIDITGQSGFEGGNQLSNVSRIIMPNCDVKYTLSFIDEDHPNPWIDASYDQIRLVIHERIADIEVFYVTLSGIYFDDTWSQGQDFFVWVGPHGTFTRPFSSTVYVSNTWNHNFDIVDENPGMSKFTWLL